MATPTSEILILHYFPVKRPDQNLSKPGLNQRFCTIQKRNWLCWWFNRCTGNTSSNQKKM